MNRKPIRSRVAVLPREGVGRRLTLSFLMVLSILLTSFLTNTAAHASLDAAQAEVEQGVGAKGQPSGLDGPDKAPHGKPFSGLSHCTGHCASHAVGLPEILTEIGVAEHPAADWPVISQAELAMNTSTRLERPPRL